MSSSPRRIAAMLGLLAVVLTMIPVDAGAVIGWCRKDPVVEVNGRRMHVYVYSTEAILNEASGPTLVRIMVPAEARVDRISEDDGFGHGYKVEFDKTKDLRVTDEGIEVEVWVRVPARAELPVRVKLNERDDDLLDREDGSTNDWVAVKALLS